MKLLLEIGLSILILFACLGIAIIFIIITEIGVALIGELSIVIILLGIAFILILYIVKNTRVIDIFYRRKDDEQTAKETIRKKT